MGMSVISSSNSYLKNDERIERNLPPNPNPSNFVIERTWSMRKNSKYLLAQIHYPDCTTYEGRKLIIFKNMTCKELKSSTKINPHFTEEGKVFMRVIPTMNGFDTAITIIKTLEKV